MDNGEAEFSLFPQYSSSFICRFFEGIVLGNYQFSDYKSEKKSLHTLKTINIFGNYNKDHLLIGQTLGESVNFGRDLGNHPANVLTPSYLADAAKVLSKEKNIFPYIGYLPLHSSPMVTKYGYNPESLPITEDLSKRIVRLPFYPDLVGEKINYIIESFKKILTQIYQL